MTDAEVVISVLVSIKVFAVRHRTNSPWRACTNFRLLCFVPQSRDFWSARAVLASLLGRRPLIEKRCEDASHSQSTSRTQAVQAVQDAVDVFRPIHIRPAAAGSA